MTEPVSSGADQPAASPTEPKGSSAVGVITAVVLLVIVVGGLMLFNRRQDAGESTTEPLVADDQATFDETLDGISLEGDTVDDVPVGNAVDTNVDTTLKSFTVAGSNFKFDPSEMRVQQGDTVRITLTNDSPMPHDWKLDEFNAATKVIQTGQQDTIEFVADQAGTFEYYCSVGSHRQMGMVGKLIVE